MKTRRSAGTLYMMTCMNIPTIDLRLLWPGYTSVFGIPMRFLCGVLQVVHLAANNLEESWADVRRVADAVGLADQGNVLVESLQRRLAGVVGSASGRGSPRVACIQWPDPWCVFLSWPSASSDIAGPMCARYLPLCTCKKQEAMERLRLAWIAHPYR
jgi:hypothetical protein